MTSDSQLNRNEGHEDNMNMTQAQFEATDEFKAYKVTYEARERNEVTLQDVLAAHDKLVALIRQ